MPPQRMSAQWAIDALERASEAVSSCLSSCAGSLSTVKLNGRTYEVVKLLGEGGFSLVYLVRDAQSGVLFALKKVRLHTRAG